MYESFYKLSARPFQLMPDPRLLFESADHKRALSYLLYGLERREGIVVITGGVGMGKTLLVQTLLGEMRNRPQSVARIAMANLDADSVLPTVASAFGLAHKSRSKIELLDELVRRALRVQDQGALLIVDEAQSCTADALEELRAISNLQANGRALMQVFLVGQTDLRELLAKPQMAHLRQRIVASHHLRPLDADEVRAYIEHRLGVVGWRGNPQFDDGVYDLAHEWTGGVPRRINLLMDRVLLYGYLEEKSEITLSDLGVVIAEYEEEFDTDQLALAGEAPPATEGSKASNVDLAELEERMRALEKSLIAALGDKRAAELISTHQAEVQNRELISAQMRMARIERMFTGWSRTAQAPGGAAGENAATVEPSADGPDEPRAGSTGDKTGAQTDNKAAEPKPGRRAQARQTPYLEADDDPPNKTAASARDTQSADAGRSHPALQANSAGSGAGASPGRADASASADSGPARGVGGRPPDTGARESGARPGDRRLSLTEAVDAIAPRDLVTDRKSGARNVTRRLFSRKK